MSYIVVSPLDKIGEMVARHSARSMISLMAPTQDFARPGAIAKNRHLHLKFNDINSSGTGEQIAPAHNHVTKIANFVRQWDRKEPLLIHCWMGISRSPAAALIAALSLAPHQDDTVLARRLRIASPFATPNARLIALADNHFNRAETLIKAVKTIGRGAEAGCNLPFTFEIE